MAAVTTPVVRLSYPHLFKPKANDKVDMLYQAALIFPKDMRAAYEALKLPEPLIQKSLERMEEMKKVAAATAIEYYGSKEKVPVAIKQMDLAKGSGWPFRDQKEKVDPDREDNAPYEAGGLFLNANSKNKPQCVDRKKMPLDEEDLYAGCWVIASLSCFGFKNSGNTGISFGLGNIQKICDGDRLGGRSTAAQDFDDIEDFGDTSASADSLF